MKCRPLRFSMRMHNTSAFIRFLQFAKKMAPVRSTPRRGQRKNSPFTKDQEAWIVIQWGFRRNITQLKRDFRTKYKFTFNQEDVENVREYFLDDRNKTKTISSAARDLEMAQFKVWKILRQSLKWKPYKERPVQPLTDQDKLCRLQACHEFVNITDYELDQIIWSDEKWFTLLPHTNRQNSRP